MSGVTQLRSGKAQTHCSFRDQDDVERPSGWRCRRREVANGDSHSLEMFSEWSLLSRKCPQDVSASGLSYVSCWVPPGGAGRVSQGLCLLRVLRLPQTALSRARCPGRAGRLGKSRAGCRAGCPTVRPQPELRGAPSPSRPARTLPAARPLHATGLIFP